MKNTILRDPGQVAKKKKRKKAKNRVVAEVTPMDEMVDFESNTCLLCEDQPEFRNGNGLAGHVRFKHGVEITGENGKNPGVPPPRKGGKLLGECREYAELLKLKKEIKASAPEGFFGPRTTEADDALIKRLDDRLRELSGCKDDQDDAAWWLS